MAEALAEHRAALDATRSSIAERCNVELEFGKIILPVFEVPEGHDRGASTCASCAWTGSSERYGDPIPAAALERLDTELEVIIDKGFAAYFLIVADFVQWAKDHGIGVGPGPRLGGRLDHRYALGITNLDPLEHGLLFERFLNPERTEMPDIDIDFDDERRGEVIEYVRDKYGEDKVAQIITFSHDEGASSPCATPAASSTTRSACRTGSPSSSPSRPRGRRSRRGAQGEPGAARRVRARAADAKRILDLGACRSRASRAARASTRPAS